VNITDRLPFIKQARTVHLPTFLAPFVRLLIGAVRRLAWGPPRFAAVPPVACPRRRRSAFGADFTLR
jgi:hypothetical protein